jgi:putative flippase GtrA
MMPTDAAADTRREQVTSAFRVSMFLLIGGLSFAVDFGLLVGLRELGHEPVWVSVSAGFWGGFAVNFWLQRRVTFAAQGHVAGHLLRYGLLVGINYAGTIVLVSSAQALGMGYAAGKLFAVALFVVVNYYAYAQWVFRDRRFVGTYV